MAAPEVSANKERDQDAVSADSRTALSQKKTVSFAETWVDLEAVLQSEVKSGESRCRMLKYILK